MKIAVFSLAYEPFLGGAEVALKEIVKRFDGNFTIFTHRFDSAWPAIAKIANAKIVRLGGGKPAKNAGDYYGRFLEKLIYIFRAWRAAEREYRENKFDAIWAMMASYAGLAALLFKLRHPSVPFLLTLQEGDSEGHILSRVGIFYPFWRLIFKKADYIQVISNYLADFARRHGAVCPIEVIPNGVDLSVFETVRPPPRRGRQAHRIFPERSRGATIITTSRLVKKNGVDILIRAMAVICKSDIKLQILGSGPDEQKLKNLATELGVSENIEFLGHVEPEKIPEYLSLADIFVRPSRSEGLGNSFLEAMAAGLAIIGTPVGGIPDFLKSYDANIRMGTNDTNNANGIFVNVNDSKDLAEKITLFLKNNELRKKLGENGRKLVLENYSWEGISSKMLRIFEKLSTFNLKLKTNLLLATGIYPPEIGGPATYAALLESELPKRGFLVEVLPFRVVRGYPSGIRHFLYFLKSLRRALRAKIVFAQDTISVGFPAMLAAKIAGRPFVIRVPGDYVWEQSVQRFGIKDGIDEFQNKKYGWRVELMRSIQKFVVGNADIVITPSKYFQKLVSGWIKHPEKVYAIYNGIDLPKINSNNKNSRTIISAGRLVPWKGFDVLIEIMKDLPDWRLEIVGDGPEYQNLKFKIENLKLVDRVILVGQIPRAELLKKLEVAGIFLLNTSFESFSFQVVEAMYAGAPVITTNIGNLAEIVENNQEGILVEPNNKKEILAAIQKINGDPEFREMIVKNAKKKAGQFSIENTINQVAKVLSKL